MQGKMIVIAVDGSRTVTELTRPPELEQLQAGVGGYIEVVPHFNVYDSKPCVALCDEEGKIKCLPFNEAACDLWQAALGRPIWPDYLVGPIVIITGDDDLLRAL